MNRACRLLIIDDEKDILKSLEVFLTIKKYDVSCAKDGQDAIRLLEAEKGKFDLVITDLKMEKVSGIAVTRWTKKHYPNLPVIVITGFLFQYESMAKEAEADLILAKPLDYKKLDHIIKDLLAKKGTDCNRGA